MTRIRKYFFEARCHHCGTRMLVPKTYESWLYLLYCCWPCKVADQKNLPYELPVWIEHRLKIVERGFREVDEYPDGDLPVVEPVVFAQEFVLR